ncbi:MAG: hypothetical protein OXN17_21655 [Candidatus Poribacteria bacterium]|nr:hypothetical protein [Candidatus Poribacteria bacterium]MDE0506344.1 hypothetical protein [Candidatus Poribacteria bacterium]
MSTGYPIDSRASKTIEQRANGGFSIRLASMTWSPKVSGYIGADGRHIFLCSAFVLS